MLGAINQSANQTLAEWLEKANSVDYQLTPGEPWPSEADYTTATAHATVDPTSTSTATADPANDSGHGGSHDSGLSAGAIAGIAIGGAVVLILAAGLLYLCGRRGGFDKAYRKSFRNSATPYPNGPPPVTEASYGSPSTGAEIWAGNKHPHSMTAGLGQSPPISPQHTAAYGLHPAGGSLVNQEGIVASYYDPHMQQFTVPPPRIETPKPEPIVPVELAASADPGNSPLPGYSQRHFSWTGEETAYRPTKP